MKKIALSLLVSILTFSAHADTLLGGDIEINAWQQDYTDTHHDSGNHTTYTFEASLEHPLPLIPNIKFAQSSAKADSFKYTKQDFTLYYEILDNDLVSIDLGAGLTHFTHGQYRSQAFDGYVPHIYGAAEIGLPLTPLFIFAKGSGVYYSDKHMTDYTAGLKYSIGLGLVDMELQAGYRIQTLDLGEFDDLSQHLDTETKGFYAGMNLDF